jgi:hypothetical protein
MEERVEEITVVVPAKELKEMRKAFLVLRGLFDTSVEYAGRLSHTDMAHHVILLNNLKQGQKKAQDYFDKAKNLENTLVA